MCHPPQVLPTLLVAQVQRPMHAAAEAAAHAQHMQRQLSSDSSNSSDSGGGSRDGGGGGGGGGGGTAPRQRSTWPAVELSLLAMQARLGVAVQRLESFFQSLCLLLVGSLPATNAWVTVTAWWLLLSFTWTLAVLLEHPGPRPA